MNIIKQNDNWLGQRMEKMTNEEAFFLMEEITNFRNTGLLNNGCLRKLEKEFSDNVSHTKFGEMMRTVEDSVLFELSRRYYNEHVQQPEDYKSLKQDDDIYYTDFENGQVEHGKICTVTYKHGAIETFSVDFDDKTFDVFDASGLGIHFFMNKDRALQKMREGEE